MKKLPAQLHAPGASLVILAVLVMMFPPRPAAGTPPARPADSGPPHNAVIDAFNDRAVEMRLQQRWMSSGRCGIDFRRLSADHDSLTREAAGRRGEAVDEEWLHFLAAAADMMARSPCLGGCRPDSIDPEGARTLLRIRASALRFADRSRQTAALSRLVLVHLGPDLWAEGISRLLQLSLSGASAEGGSPPWYGEHVWSDVRLDLAIFTVLAEFPDSLRRRFGPVKIPGKIWLKQLILQVAEQTAGDDLGAYYLSHGELPAAVADEEGRPLPGALPSLCSASREGAPWSGNLSCWFQGWPGFRIVSYDRAGPICVLGIEGTGIPSRDLWGFWIRPPQPESPGGTKPAAGSFPRRNPE